LQIQVQQKKIDELANKRRKKVAIDCNQVFTNITKIKEAQDEESRLKETWKQRDRALEAKKPKIGFRARAVHNYISPALIIDLARSLFVMFLPKRGRGTALTRPSTMLPFNLRAITRAPEVPDRPTFTAIISK
jgi:hypothetical protein